MADVEQTKKVIPLITCEISLGQYVCDLILSVSVFDLDLGIQIDSIKQRIKSNSVGSGNMSHCRTSSLYMIILITASLSSKIYNKSFLTKWKELRPGGPALGEQMEHDLRTQGDVVAFS